MKIVDAVLNFLFGRIPVEDPLVPFFLSAHKDHMDKCPECRRHYLCRGVICRIICARCDVKYQTPKT